MKNFHLPSLLCLALAVLMSPASASSSADAALARFIDGVRTFAADFEQVQRDDSGRVLQSSSGRISLSRPGRFHWQVSEPFEQTLVADGESLWFHDPELDQVTRRPARDALDGTPAALLAEGAGLSEAFEIEEGGSRDGQDVVVLRPRSAESDFVSVRLTVRDDGAPTAISFEDQLGGITTVVFSGLRVNPSLPAETFRFVPPAGAEVVELGG